jgi:heme-degrading monooxygenase HmoA
MRGLRVRIPRLALFTLNFGSGSSLFAGAKHHTRKQFCMITVGMNYHVLPGKQQDFEQKFAAVIDALKAAPGHTSSTLWKDVSDDASYLITSEWNEEQAFTDFIRSQAFRDVTNWGKEQILSGRPQHKVYKH